jgi:flagellar biosynthetic protein FlhB
MAADDQEKTEEATPKKIEDARKEGNVPKSQDMSGLFTLFVSVLTLLGLLFFMKEQIFAFFIYVFQLSPDHISRENIIELSIITVKVFILTAVLMAIPVAISGILGAFAQFGFIFTTKPLVPDLKKLDPIKGMKNVISMKKLIDGAKITFKAFATFGVGFFFFWEFIKELPTVAMYPLFDQMEWLFDKAIIIAFVMLLVTFFFAVIDIYIVRYQYFEKLKMSKQEVKDEFKNIEGDPLVKQKIRQIQMQMSQKRMMSNIPEADVVVTNPTHYSVALRYKKGEDHVPKVIAKGVDHMAFRIREIAIKHKVRIVENPPLARSLYKDVEVDEVIPEKFFNTVAELLAYVYKLDNRTE